MTKVILKQRPLLHSVQLASAADAFRFRLGDSILLAASMAPWYARAFRWVAERIFRVRTAPPPMMTVVAVNHDNGKVMLELSK